MTKKDLEELRELKQLGGSCPPYQRSCYFTKKKKRDFFLRKYIMSQVLDCERCWKEYRDASWEHRAMRQVCGLANDFERFIKFWLSLIPNGR